MAKPLITSVIGVTNEVHISFTRYDDGKARMMAGQFSEGGKVVDIVFDFAELIDTVRILLGQVQRGAFDEASPLGITPEQRAELVASFQRVMESEKEEAQQVREMTVEMARIVRPDVNLSVVLGVADAIDGIYEEAAGGLTDVAL